MNERGLFLTTTLTSMGPQAYKTQSLPEIPVQPISPTLAARVTTALYLETPIVTAQLVQLPPAGLLKENYAQLPIGFQPLFPLLPLLTPLQLAPPLPLHSEVAHNHSQSKSVSPSPALNTSGAISITSTTTTATSASASSAVPAPKRKNRDEKDFIPSSEKKKKIKTIKTSTYEEFLSNLMKDQDIAYQEVTGNEKSILPGYRSNPTLLWPDNNQVIQIAMSYLNETLFQLEFKDQNHTEFLALHVDIEKHILKIHKKVINEIWSELRINDIINLFNLYFCMDREDMKKVSNQCKNMDELSARCKQYQNHYSLMSTFLSNDTKYIKNEHVFWMTQPHNDFKDVSFKLTFTSCEIKRDSQYYSYVFSEKEYLKRHNIQHAPGTQKYYRMQVYEEANSNSSTKILDVWFSLYPNKRFGELRDLAKGNKLNGSQVMEFFDRLVQDLLKMTVYLCDAARTNGGASEVDQGQIILRLMLALKGQTTWYERFGYKHFDFNKCESGDPTENKYLSQNTIDYYAAREKLSNLPLKTLFKFFEQNRKGSHTTQLNKLSVNRLNFDLSADNKSEKEYKICDLVDSFYRQLKETKNDDELKNFSDLLQLPKKSGIEHDIDQSIRILVNSRYLKKTYDFKQQYDEKLEKTSSSMAKNAR